MVVVRLHGTLRGESGVHEVTVAAPSGTSVGEVLISAVASHPALGPVLLDDDAKPRANVVIFCNGRNVRLERGLDTLIPADAQLSVFPSTGAQRAFG